MRNVKFIAEFVSELKIDHNKYGGCKINKEVWGQIYMNLVLSQKQNVLILDMSCETP